MVAIASASFNRSSSGSLGELKPLSGSMSASPSQGNGLGNGRRRRHYTKSDAAYEFISNLRARGNIDVDQEGFQASIVKHFEDLPTRYALDVNISSLDVLNHKRLLDSARSDPAAVSFQVRPVDVTSGADISRKPSIGSLDTVSSPFRNMTTSSSHRPAHRSLPRPAFGSSPNLAARMFEAEERQQPAASSYYEVTIASVDQPKLLSRLSECLADTGLNIAEAHAFGTRDAPEKFVLDVFVVNSWNGSTEELEDVLSDRLQQLPPPGNARQGGSSRSGSLVNAASLPVPATAAAVAAAAAATSARDAGELRVPESELAALQRISIGSELADDWEIDPQDLVFHEKVAAGAFGDLFRGVFCGQDVAIKILRGVHGNSSQLREFLQEVCIMRKVRHRNVVQFIGACTKAPNLCIVFEYMRGGSVYDSIRRQGPLRITHVMRLAMEVCRGMDYLHRRKIVHRDLKTANLLLDEHGTVKIADFGVARVMDNLGGEMTAETGTYRWMAPEVIEHKPYDEKADVFSFGVVLWELLTAQVPYTDMTPLQAAVGVVQKGLRPPIPPTCPPPLSDVMRLCWQRDPAVRPSFELLKRKMEEMYEVYKAQDEAQALGEGPSGSGSGSAAAPKGKTTPGLLSRLRASGTSFKKA